MQNLLRKIIIIGPQGSGKGTQAEALAREFVIPHISSGEIFRQHINNRTEIGQKVKLYLDQGKLVPDELTDAIIKNRISQDDCRTGFILDGYPRNTGQARALEKIAKIDVVLEIWISDREVVTRLSGRRVCSCGATYHIKYKPPKREGICDQCGRAIKRRDDEAPEVLNQRLAIYHRETEPLLDYYRGQRLLIKVNGEQSISEVTSEMLSKLLNKDFAK